MVKIGEKLNRDDFLKGANNGTIKTTANTKKRENNQFFLSVGSAQNKFINKLAEMTKLRKGDLVWQSILYAKNQNITTSFINEYINFIYDKKHGIRIYIQKVMTSHENLKEASELYKKEGYNIKIKGVLLAYLLNYAQNHLKIDISEYRNFN
ncbi:hypothetical protein [Gilliamella sp. BG6]|uniref:hypothetical protein n=1 Tax=unclassified Gilliamella TaxID=2685620 RepID=UPI003986FAEF